VATTISQQFGAILELCKAFLVDRSICTYLQAYSLSLCRRYFSSPFFSILFRF
jgi:hypothetical protein